MIVVFCIIPTHLNYSHECSDPIPTLTMMFENLENVFRQNISTEEILKGKLLILAS